MRVGVGEGAGARGLQSGVVEMCSSARVGVGEGAEACSSINFGRPGAVRGSSVAFGSAVGKRFRGCCAKRLYAHSAFDWAIIASGGSYESRSFTRQLSAAMRPPGAAMGSVSGENSSFAAEQRRGRLRPPWGASAARNSSPSRTLRAYFDFFDGHRAFVDFKRGRFVCGSFLPPCGRL